MRQNSIVTRFAKMRSSTHIDFYNLKEYKLVRCRSHKVVVAIQLAAQSYDKNLVCFLPQQRKKFALTSLRPRVIYLYSFINKSPKGLSTIDTAYRDCVRSKNCSCMLFSSAQQEHTVYNKKQNTATYNKKYSYKQHNLK